MTLNRTSICLKDPSSPDQTSQLVDQVSWCWHCSNGNMDLSTISCAQSTKPQEQPDGADVRVPCHRFCWALGHPDGTALQKAFHFPSSCQNLSCSGNEAPSLEDYPTPCTSGCCLWLCSGNQGNCTWLNGNSLPGTVLHSWSTKVMFGEDCPNLKHCTLWKICSE